MRKYYRKKGTDKATHKAEIRYESGHIAQDGLGQHIGFISLGTNIICDIFRGEAAFNQFLKENDFEEVMEWHKPEVGKRYIQRITKNYPEEHQLIFWIKKIILNAYYFDGNHQTMVWPFDDTLCSQLFWETYEELPEDNIEPTKEDLQIKSIWKDVSELPKESCALIVEMETGLFEIIYAVNRYSYDGTWNVWLYRGIFRGEYVNGEQLIQAESVPSGRIKRWCLLTDYINNTEERLKIIEMPAIRGIISI